MKLAIQGLGRMGMQIARKLAESGEHTVIAHNRSHEPIDEAAQSGATPAYEKADVLRAFGEDQVVIWIMLPSEIVDAQVDEWLALVPKGSILIDGGNSDFRSTQKLNEKVSVAGCQLLDIGVSGGVWGYQNGFPLMCGGDNAEAFAALEPALKTLTQPGGMYYRFGGSGAGHYVKMVHNAIEYGMMESLGEGFRMLHDGPYKGMDLSAAADLWQHHSVITSWLTELSRDALAENPELDGITGYVAESGEARWTLDAAKDMGIELPSIQAAFDVRLRSQKGETNFATKVVAAQRNKFGGHNLNGEGAAAGVREQVAREETK
ncbi:MAG TPA: NADP-dependent phosphogluconate dehydrogenase [Candidatus Saccharimonadales bacterium]|nr:NADP-dependent phosphogluconate dehydrogenase [Candidatus Saccharimonadales bacterium]